MPTHTAYAVPTGRPRIAYASPPMLSARAAAKTAVGPSRVNPSDRPRAEAQTASRTPDRTRTSQYMANSWSAVLSLSGYGALVRESGKGPDPENGTCRGGRPVRPATVELNRSGRRDPA